jgi:hypothetical protein
MLGVLAAAMVARSVPLGDLGAQRDNSRLVVSRDMSDGCVAGHP